MLCHRKGLSSVQQASLTSRKENHRPDRVGGGISVPSACLAQHRALSGEFKLLWELVLAGETTIPHTQFRIKYYEVGYKNRMV